ncbi:PucR family transcriptional regulator [Allofournierella sp.]|uniref:PucR family transcriptional regulator n=1 Tax=Allofournierella sp. TaxID=1940256 RepID=UPI003AB2ECA7
MEQVEKWRLVQAALEGESLGQIVEKASLFLSSPLVIIGNTGNIVAHSTALTAPDEIWQQAVKRGYITLEFSATLSRWDQLKDKGARYECMTVSQINGRRRRFYRLMMHSQLLGYMNVTEAGEAFDSTGEEEYHFVAQLIAKELYTQLKFSDLGRKTQNEDILLDLVNDRFVNRGHFIDCLRTSSLRTDVEYRVLCADLADFLSYNAGRDSFKLELLEFFPGGTIVISGQALVMLAQTKHCDPASTERLKKFDGYLKKKKLVCGVSDPLRDLFAFRRYREQALNAVRLRQYLMETQRNYVFYDEVKVYDLLSQIPRSELMYYCGRQAYELYQYDQAQQTCYLNTLMVYLQTNRSVNATARYLHVHRNTINYRISKMRELFQLDLESFSVTNQILLSCQLIKLMEGPHS